MGTLFVDKLDPQSGTSLEIGSSGDTITIPSGATIANSGTATGFGGSMTPAFYATATTTRAIPDSAWTALTYNTEVWDSAGCFDTSTGKFTPTTAGKYFLFASMRWDTDVNFNISYLGIYKNTSVDAQAGFPQDYYNIYYTGAIFEANGSSDYFWTKAQHNQGGSQNLSASAYANFFGGYKIIE